MLETITDPDVAAPPRTRPKSAYQEAELGFRNYWYPVYSSREIGQNPTRAIICGDNIVFMRRNGKAYAIAEHCPHRGTSFALYPEKTYPFAGSNTITCPYHGWTFDVTNGRCVANVCEGPDSNLPGMVGTKTYPVQERSGIIWIWMGDMEPVALEEDWPHFIFREGTTVKMLNRVKNGNWRWHAENGPDGHAPMVHMNSPRMWWRPTGPQNAAALRSASTKTACEACVPRSATTTGTRIRCSRVSGAGRYSRSGAACSSAGRASPATR